MTKIEVREVLLVLRDSEDHEVGDPQWQDIFTHNIVVKLLTLQPLSKGDMEFLKIQNDQLRREKK